MYCHLSHIIIHTTPHTDEAGKILSWLFLNTTWRRSIDVRNKFSSSLHENGVFIHVFFLLKISIFFNNMLLYGKAFFIFFVLRHGRLLNSSNFLRLTIFRFRPCYYLHRIQFCVIWKVFPMNESNGRHVVKTWVVNLKVSKVCMMYVLSYDTVKKTRSTNFLES